MKHIHNTKKRMPFILPMNEARGWIEPDLTKTEIKAACSHSMRSS
jgi:hypothetical protein